jgi:hypothetical protein
MTVVGEDEATIESGLTGLRHTIAFYGSTPAYRPVLEHHGMGSLGDELHLLSRAGDWPAMASAVPADERTVELVAGVRRRPG